MARPANGSKSMPSESSDDCLPAPSEHSEAPSEAEMNPKRELRVVCFLIPTLFCCTDLRGNIDRASLLPLRLNSIFTYREKASAALSCMFLPSSMCENGGRGAKGIVVGGLHAGYEPARVVITRQVLSKVNAGVCARGTVYLTSLGHAPARLRG